MFNINNKKVKVCINKKKVKHYRLYSSLILCLVMIIFFIAAGSSAGIYLGVIKNSESLKNINVMPNIYTSIIYENKSGKEIDRINASENREYVLLKDIPENLQNAFIAIEDERFYEHNGVDPRGLMRAIISKIIRHKTQGASTITQQLIKNTVTKVSHNNFRTKLQEQYLALKFERELTEKLGDKESAKKHILEVYLNTIYLYHGLNGVKTAAQYYFNKNVSDLSLAESAVIAAITKSPTYYAPDKEPEHNKLRKNIILNKMFELNYITQEELDEALKEDVYAKVEHTKKTKEESKKTFHSYFVDKLIKDVESDLEKKFKISHAESVNLVYGGGLKIYACIDTEMQKILDDCFCDDSNFPQKDYELDANYYLTIENKNLNEQRSYTKNKTVKNQKEANEFVESVKKELITDEYKMIDEKLVLIPQPQAAMIIIDYHNGEVKALRGGRGEKNFDFALNRAIDSERQPGSVFKILASYAPAIDLQKITAATIIDDAPYETPDGYKPKNYYKGYRGPSTVREGIRDSMNILAVKNMISTGVSNCFNYLLRFGFTTLVDGEKINGKIYSDRVASTALGGITHGVNQLEVTAAFGAIANAGEYIKPIFYTKVLDHDGNLLLNNAIQNKKVISTQAAYIITDMMCDVVTKGTGKKAKFDKIKMPISGKTGTTNDTRDLTFVGYTPYYVAGIWFGFDQPKQIKEDRGYHLLLWKKIMEKIHSKLETKNFVAPEEIITANICKNTGLLASESCKSHGASYKEIFISGTQPKNFCTKHIKILDKTKIIDNNKTKPTEEIFESGSDINQTDNNTTDQNYDDSTSQEITDPTSFYSHDDQNIDSNSEIFSNELSSSVDDN
jgi:penicillin-binding protein 1A